MCVLLRVRGEAFLARPVAHRVADAVADVGRQPALADVDHLVPAARLVQAEHRPVLRRRERVLHLVAVEEDVGLARDDRLERRLSDARDPLQRVAHLRVLLLDLRLVREILEAAAAAGREVLARRLDAERACGEHVGRERLGEAALHLRHARADAVARQAAAHEDDEAVQPRDAVAAEGERLDVELELFVHLHRRGHDRNAERPGFGQAFYPAAPPVSFAIACSCASSYVQPGRGAADQPLRRPEAFAVIVDRHLPRSGERRDEDLALARPVELAEEDSLPAAERELAVVERDEDLRCSSARRARARARSARRDPRCASSPSRRRRPSGGRSRDPPRRAGRRAR